ncbi:hypothetical protein Vadar_007629 [Vaccinium darrowii]|uniref:Uncharacterized protein n=1 Tax=Vaccinium darrowii TaxID=229202 RepID=A0ACB7XNX0_9ERIC|nr:hypothetical protein Vadar_007629 [Vaccinium darrowii]
MEDNNNQQHIAAAAAEEKGKALEEEEDNRITGGGGDGGSASMAVVVFLPPDIVEGEVLTRLPVKSLMRFKCVSKLWCSTISNPSFSKSRYTPASGLFIIAYPPDNNNRCRDSSSSSLRCFYATLPRPPPIIGGEGEKVAAVAEEEEEHHQFTNLPMCKYKYKFSGATQVINGLFCLFADHHAWVCSISTGEIRKLTDLCLDELLAEIACNYYFGFVATSNEYKLLKLCTRDLFKERDCAVLTLGKDTLWRTRLRNYSDYPPEPEIYVAGDSIYIDGTLYCWSGMDFCSGELIAFSFQDESFQVIGPPPRASTTLVDPSDLVLLQFRGHFAVAKEKNFGGLVDRELELWVLEQSTPSSYKWFYEVINIPLGFPYLGFSFLGNLPPTGEMLLTSFATDHESAVPVYSYDHTKGKFEKFIIGKFPLSPYPAAAASIPKDTNKLRIWYYEEDITPLKDLIPIVKNKKKKKQKGSRPPSLMYNRFPFLFERTFLTAAALASLDK